MMRAHLQVTDYDADGRPGAADLGRYGATMSPVLTRELEGVSSATGLSCEEIMLAALGRTIQRTLGEGFAAVDVIRAGTGSVAVTLPCIGPDRLPATDMLAAVHASLGAASGQRGVHPAPRTASRSDVLFAFGEPVPTSARRGQYLELHVRAVGAGLLLEWWYDVRSFEPYTIVELAEQFPYAMIELTAEVAPIAAASPQLAAAY